MTYLLCQFGSYITFHSEYSQLNVAKTILEVHFNTTKPTSMNAVYEKTNRQTEETLYVYWQEKEELIIPLPHLNGKMAGCTKLGFLFKVSSNDFWYFDSLKK